MVQEQPNVMRRPGLLGEAARQSLRLLGLIVACDLLLRRGAQGAMGLRLSEENEALRFLTSLGDRCEATLEAMLLIGAVLVCAVVPLVLMRQARPVAVLTGAAALITGYWALAWRVAHASVPPPHHAFGLVVLGLALITSLMVARARPVLLSLAGAAACSAWLVTAVSSDDPIDVLEQGGELLLLAGMPVAWLLVGGLRRQAAFLGVALPVGCGLSWAFLAHEHLTTHVCRHLFSLGEAGVSGELFLPLLALALVSLAGLALAGERGRGIALGLFLLLAATRGPGPELLALRCAAAVALVYVAAANETTEAD